MSRGLGDVYKRQIERLSDSTYSVHRHDRRRKKWVTLNVTQLHPCTSPHPANPEEDKSDDEEKRHQEARQERKKSEEGPNDTNTRNSSRFADKSKKNYAKEEDIIDDDDVEAILELVAAVQAMRAIKHLLPCAAQRLPFFKPLISSDSTL